jgi:hypothetical protein
VAGLSHWDEARNTHSDDAPWRDQLATVKGAVGMRPFSAQDQQILTAQRIDAHGPGTVLHDFDTLLEVVGTRGIAVTNQNHRLPLKVLAPLNARMTHSIEHGLNRPQQRSYPHINALYLLVRASGLTDIEGSGSTWRLRVDPVVLESWRGLNPSEQYFTLLETWLLRGRPEILEPDAGLYFPAPIGEWKQFVDDIPDPGRRIAGDPEEDTLVKYSPGLLTIGMLDLFGLISVAPGPPAAGKGWCIARVKRTRWGDALLHVLAPPLLSMPFLIRLDSPTDVVFGELQEILQPLFPAWRHNLTFPESAFRDGTYLFKISWGRVWRRIAISGQADLDSLGQVIIGAFDFTYDHLYRFSYRNRFGVLVRINHPELEEPPLTTDVRVGDLPLRPGGAMTYLYDFGDRWEFDVQLERIDPVEPCLDQARIVEVHGEAPVQYPWVDDGDE